MLGQDAALQIETVASDPVPTRVHATGEWTFSGLKERRDEILLVSAIDYVSGYLMAFGAFGAFVARAR